MHDKYGLLSASEGRVLFKMAGPSALGVFAILMFSLVDTYFVSLLGTQALAALSFTFPITLMVSSITMGLGTGIATLVAHKLGQRRREAAAQLTTHGLILALVIISCVSFLGWRYHDPFFSLLGADNQTLPLIEEYMQIWFICIPLLVIPMTGSSAIRATGDTRLPSLIMIFAGLINGILDPLLIFGWGPFPELGIAGAALASGISWGAALLLTLRILMQREHLLNVLSIFHLKVMLQHWRKILHLSTPAALTNMLTPAANAILMAMLATQGQAVVAAFGAGQRIEAILLIPMIALSSSLAPFMAQNLGAQQSQRAVQGYLISQRSALILQFVLFAIVALGAPWIAQLFAQESAVSDVLTTFLQIVPIAYGAVGIAMLANSALNALKKPIWSLRISAVRLFLALIPSAWIGLQIAGATGLFIGIMVGNILVGFWIWWAAHHYIQRQTI